MPNTISEFFKTVNFNKIYKMLSESAYEQLNAKIENQKIGKDGLVEHAFERLFGYLFDYYGLKICCIDHVAKDYSEDNRIITRIAIDHAPPRTVETIRNIIAAHNIRIMAIYFPQFHEIEENNKLWGKGFTEWTLLKNYKGEIKHPHIDIGCYNMLDFHTRKKQAMIARKHGVDAFCYYHYWFKDKKVMYEGIEKILQDGQPDLPFMFCWANEPWTRNWDGSEQEVLLSQDYGTEEDWMAHYNYFSQFFKHPSYIKEDNCPLLYIYRIQHIIENNGLPMLTMWKELAKKDGFAGLKIMPILSAFVFDKTKLEGIIDGLVEHQPGYNMTRFWQQWKHTINGNNFDIDRNSFYETIKTNPKLADNYTRGLFYSWDHSSRRFNKVRFKFFNLAYDTFEDFLVSTILKIAIEPNKTNNFILLNSWNEWTEQAMFEPNNYDGYELLKILQKYFAKNEC